MKSILRVVWMVVCPIAVGGIALLFLACLGMEFPLQFAFTIATGWLSFLLRVVPQTEVDGGAIFLGCGAFGLFVVGLHLLLRSFYASYNRADLATLAANFDDWGKGPPCDSPSSTVNHGGRWRLRWTVSAATIGLLMFVAGIAFVGITHQTIWLLTSPEPILGSNWTARYRVQSGVNLKNLAVATQAYAEPQGTLPPGMTIDAEGRQLHSWMTLLLPMLEDRPLYDRIDLQRPWDDPVQGTAFATSPRVFQSPDPRIHERTDAEGRALTHYSANVHVMGGSAVRSLSDISDGAANTILFGEAAGNYVPWGKPGNWRDPVLGINQSPAGFGGPLKKGSMFVFADGRVQYLSNETSPEVLRALSTPAGGEATHEY